MSSDNVVFDVDTQETIFSEIALNAQQTIKAMSGIGYGLATHGDFLPRLIQQYEIILSLYGRYKHKRDDDTFYAVLINIASICVMWAMLIRQRNTPQKGMQ